MFLLEQIIVSYVPHTIPSMLTWFIVVLRHPHQLIVRLRLSSKMEILAVDLRICSIPEYKWVVNIIHLDSLRAVISSWNDSSFLTSLVLHNFSIITFKSILTARILAFSSVFNKRITNSECIFALVSIISPPWKGYRSWSSSAFAIWVSRPFTWAQRTCVTVFIRLTGLRYWKGIFNT